MQCVICKKTLNNSTIYMAYDKCHCSEVCRNNTIIKSENINKEEKDNYKIYNLLIYFKNFF